MADLAASAVAIDSDWTEGGVQGKRRSVRKVTLTLTAQGTTANKITAAVLGLATIEESSIFVKSDNTVVYKTCPSADGSVLLFCLAAAGDTPADVTATVKGTVKGPSS